MAEERIQKIIARSGLCSRRDADQMIADGRVTVDGRVARSGEKADLKTARIKVDGRAVRAPESLRYLLLYKPRAVMTTCDDPEERKTVLDFVRPVIRERVYPVGRLDYHSEGLLILTNDGELAARITHPRFGIVREYLVKIRGDLTPSEYRKLMAGTSVEGRHVKPKQAQRESKVRGGKATWWRLQVSEGRTHEVRELFLCAGHHVQRLRRTAIGPLRDDSLNPGDFRTISAKELTMLQNATSKSKRSSTRRPARQSGQGPAKQRNTARKRSERKR